MVEIFSQRWLNKGDEKSDTQKFWLDLLQNICSLANPLQYIEFEKRVELSHMSFIDAYIPSTGIVIEQKSVDVNLDAPAKQSDGTNITPFEQAKRYRDWLPASQQGRYIITCNFRELRVYDMETPKAEPQIITLENLEREKNNLSFLVKPGHVHTHEIELSLRAGELIGKLYDEILTRYKNPDDKASQQSLNIFCVRVVFLLYAEDSGLFPKSAFHDYLLARKLFARDALRKLFEILDQKPEDRDTYLEDDLKIFPYVNGGLFADENIEIPQINGEPLRIILEEMSEGFDWSGISPTIFGALFESTLNPKTRHTGGMHYTAPENIHKVIDPLFMDELNSELAEIMTAPPSRERNRNLRAFQKKLASLKFFDPACGSGNFLTETYLSLRTLENKIITELTRGQVSFAFSQNETPIQISISQFYGIEINNFAVSVARAALWIAETQMLNATRKILQVYDEVLPLKTYNNIIENNALLTSWNDIVKPDEKLYIIGNPPFIGYSNQTHEQKQEILNICGDTVKAGKIDYVSAWYYKASEFIQGTGARAAFVSTNSICQGEQVTSVWKPLFTKLGMDITFAHQAFKWDSEAEDKAQVHVVVIGFRNHGMPGPFRLYTRRGLRLVKNINAYLVEGPDVFAEAVANSLTDDAPVMKRGSQSTDGGNLIMTLDEMQELLRTDPLAENFIRPFMMGNDFIQRAPRYCLWLVGVNPSLIAKCPRVMARIKKCREFRLASKKAATRRKAETSALFESKVECTTNYIAIPKTSSGERCYVPMGWLDENIIPGDSLRIIPDGTLYHFGILTSRIHMAWMRRVAGYFGTSYSYSNTVVYNTFPWPVPTAKQRAKIEHTAQKILDARALYQNSSFADLYNDAIMPIELRKAHRDNDEAVCAAYGWSRNIDEEEIVTELFELYGDLVKRKSK